MILSTKREISITSERKMKSWSLSSMFRGKKVHYLILLHLKNKWKITKNITLSSWLNNCKMIMISFYPKITESTIMPGIFRIIGVAIDSKIQGHHSKILKNKKNSLRSLMIDLRLHKLSTKKRKTTSKVIKNLPLIISIDLDPASHLDSSKEKGPLPMTLSIARIRKDRL